MKPGKDPTKITGYRPKALTSHLGKVMERMAVDRLIYVTEDSCCFHLFRRGRNNTDPAVSLESEIRKAQGIVGAVFGYRIDRGFL